MRRVDYPAIGKPPALTTDLVEYLVLVQGAIEIANVERWALDHGNSPAPAIAGLLRDSAYEVTVVDVLHRLARREFEKQNVFAVWERPLATGKKGRPRTIDISLFDRPAPGSTTTLEETRIELGLYSKKKLKDDATKLHDERSTPYAKGYSVGRNILLLWDVEDAKNSKIAAKAARDLFVKDAAAASTKKRTVALLVCSCVDLFAANDGDHRVARVGLFEVT